MDRAIWLLGLLATLGLGLTGGALLTEAMVLAVRFSVVTLASYWRLGASTTLSPSLDGPPRKDYESRPLRA